eukprot:comp11538_c0_seq1/m.5993 comp11538_c0_seq1/g.5993  ORF comp11538_c0_seq1/g.5993 comp11538_c0_seq1/m.5993 type:complete len:212 (-) comp11538_c0_seq1:68-703(-)
MEKDRIQGMMVVKPIVYGNTATLLPKKGDGVHTHRWTVYVRSVDGEDMSKYVSKVVFTLHESFKDNVRVITDAPYEVTEIGWGEFDIQIRLHFINNYEKSVNITHKLRLFEDPTTVKVSKKMLASETMEELVFVDPVEELYDQLAAATATAHPVQHYRDYTLYERQQLEALEAARAHVRSLIHDLRTRRRHLEEEVRALRPERSLAMGVGF